MLKNKYSLKHYYNSGKATLFFTSNKKKLYILFVNTSFVKKKDITILSIISIL